MNFNDISAQERQIYLQWLTMTYPALSVFAANVDRALVKGRKMTINNHFGISFSSRQMLIAALKEYYQLAGEKQQAREQ